MKFGGIFVALVFALAACSSDPEPREPQTTSAPTPTSTVTAPTMPAQAREDSPEGAAAFVTYWVEVSNYAAATGDVEELSRLSSPDCSGCQKYIDLYRTTYEDGGYFKGGDWRIGQFKVTPSEPETFLTTTLKAPQSEYRESSSQPVAIDPEQDTKISFAVEHNDAWLVTQLGLGDVE